MRLTKSKSSAPFLWCGVATSELGAPELARLEDVLDDEERARIVRLRAAPLRRDSTAAHGLCRVLLAAFTGRPAHSFRFYRDTSGAKPRAEGLLQIDFSLTHCHGYAAAAAGAFGRIGIDAEPLDRRVEPELVAGNSETPYEGAAGTVIAWTLKEALSKAEGSGLALGFSRLDVEINPPRLLAAPDSFGNPAGWKLERHCHAGFTIAIAFGPRGAGGPHGPH
jgi:4'-phosphopantetheinyl transferase